MQLNVLYKYLKVSAGIASLTSEFETIPKCIGKIDVQAKTR